MLFMSISLIIDYDYKTRDLNVKSFYSDSKILSTEDSLEYGISSSSWWSFSTGMNFILYLSLNILKGREWITA